MKTRVSLKYPVNDCSCIHFSRICNLHCLIHKDKGQTKKLKQNKAEIKRVTEK